MRRRPGMRWARVVELCFACWLGASPLIFEHTDGSWLAWDLLAGAATALLACLSMWRPTRRAHLLILAVAGAMVVHAALAPDPLAAAPQNHLVVGVTLLMLALVPTEALDPPEAWTREAAQDEPERPTSDGGERLAG